MQIKLFEKTGEISTSPIYIGYLILKNYSKYRNCKVISIYKLLKLIKEINVECDAKQFTFALVFLYMNGVIRFEAPYIILNSNA